MDNNVITETRARYFIITLIALFIISGAVTYAFFTARITGGEDEDTVIIKGGDMKINFDGGKVINMQGVHPKEGPTATKNFTVTGNNTTQADMNYSLTLRVTKNTFSSNILKYKMDSTNEDGNGAPVSQINDLIDINTGPSELLLGTGLFTKTDGDKVHSYSLEIHFPSRGISQNEEQGKEFSGYVQIKGID